MFVVMVKPGGLQCRFIDVRPVDGLKRTGGSLWIIAPNLPQGQHHGKRLVFDMSFLLDLTLRGNITFGTRTKHTLCFWLQSHSRHCRSATAALAVTLATACFCRLCIFIMLSLLPLHGRIHCCRVAATPALLNAALPQPHLPLLHSCYSHAATTHSPLLPQLH